MRDPYRVMVGLLLGSLFPAAVVGIAALAPYANDQFMTPIDGRILSVAWWFMVPLGTVAAITAARREWPGVLIGVVSVFGFGWSLALLVPASDRPDALASVAAWVSAAASVALPWAIGMVFGWNAIHRRAVRTDGSPHGTGTSAV